jgi:hypothetical protein
MVIFVFFVRCFYFYFYKENQLPAWHCSLPFTATTTAVVQSDFLGVSRF